MKKRKVKLFASIASLGLVVAVMGVGVWAATQQAVRVSSQVSFTATSVAADIKLSVNNAVAPADAEPGEAAKYAAGKEYDIVKEATLSVEMKGLTGDEANQYKKSDLYKHLLYSEAVPTEITADGENKGKYTKGDPIVFGKDRAQARRIAYFNNDTAKTLYENRVFLNLQDKDEDGYLNVGAKVVYEFTIDALASSAPIYYEVTANLFDTWFYQSDAGIDYKISDIFEVQVFDVSTTRGGNVTFTDQENGIQPSLNATANDVTTDISGGDVTDTENVPDATYPTAFLTNWKNPSGETTADTFAIQPGDTRTIQVVYTVKDIDGPAKHLYQGISYTMKSLQLGDIYIKLANNGNNLGNIPDYAEGNPAQPFDKIVDWKESKDEKPEGTDPTPENGNGAVDPEDGTSGDAVGD